MVQVQKISDRTVRILLIVLPTIIFICFLPFLLYGIIAHYYESQMFTDVSAVPAARVALVLGAGVHRDRSPSPILADRIKAAVALYKAGKVKKLLMSGDNRVANYHRSSIIS